MALPASDTFAGTGALSGSWTLTQNAPERVSGVVQATLATENTAGWTGDAFGNDHYAQIVVADAVSSAGGGAGIFVRLSGSGGTTQGYMLQTCLDTGTLYKITNGTTYVALQNLGSTFADGDTAYIEAVGTTVICKKNGAQIGSNQTDSAFTSGMAGLWFYGALVGALDDFVADTIGAGSGTVMPVLLAQFRRRRTS